jgi:hypothetical protein
MDLPQCAGFNAGSKRKVTIIPLRRNLQAIWEEHCNLRDEAIHSRDERIYFKVALERTGRMAALGRSPIRGTSSL